MRGEYGDSDGDGEAVGELPPHARRILPGAAVDEHGGGTTSACAENTPHNRSKNASHRNYLRVRGEYGSRWHTNARASELPPRARRIPLLGILLGLLFGTTSACAENTLNELGLL